MHFNIDMVTITSYSQVKYYSLCAKYIVIVIVYHWRVFGAQTTYGTCCSSYFANLQVVHLPISRNSFSIVHLPANIASVIYSQHFMTISSVITASCVFVNFLCLQLEITLSLKFAVLAQFLNSFLSNSLMKIA